MEIIKTQLEGCFLLEPKEVRDARGCFVKPYQRAAFESLGLHGDFREDFFTVSQKSVVRGMHFQEPPHAQIKLVYCIQGEVLDVAIDLRKGSPTYLKVDSFILNDSNRRVIYLPDGIAHGFLVQSESATLGYKVSCEFAPERDAGIRWNSIDFKWPVTTPILSERDQKLPPLSEYQTPFIWQGPLRT